MAESHFVVSPREPKAGINVVGGATSSSSHSFSDEEKVAFTEYINSALSHDPDLKGKMPIPSHDMSLFSAVGDGILLCKLINFAVPDTIDERVINKKNLNAFKIHENQTLCVTSSKSIGCNVVNIGAQDLIDGKSHLVLGLVWQIIRIGLFAKINLVHHPELYRLLEEGETIDDLLKLGTDQILLRWVNYHLKNAGHPKRIHNFGKDIADSEAYTILLNQLAPQKCDKKPLSESDTLKRAELVLVNADKLGCRKFVSPKDIVKGNAKLNLAFVANLFNTCPGLAPVEFKAIEETREEKTFRNWINSLGIDPFVNNLYTDLQDGLALIRLFQKVSPGLVDEKRVNWEPNKALSPNMKKLENCNYAVELGKQLNFSLVGIAGKDILDGNKTLTLAVVYQLMRFHLISILQKLGGGKKIQDPDIISWANAKVAGANKSTHMKDFKDSSLKNGHFLIDLVDAVRPGAVDYSSVEKAEGAKENLLNAKYAVSVARKIGAVIFALPEDIVEVKNKMIMTFVASVMVIDMGGSH